jgi:hypothetical protein
MVLKGKEHWLCKLYWFSKRNTGSTMRSFSRNPSVAEPHLHPCVDIIKGGDAQKIFHPRLKRNSKWSST